MKKKRGLFVILAGVVLLCVLIVCYVALLKVNSSEEKTTEEETAQEEAVAIASDDISTLTFEAGDQTLTFQKGEDSWTLEGQEDFPVDASKVDSAVSYVRLKVRYPSRISVAATASTVFLCCFIRLPEAWRMPWASTVVRRSSQSTGLRPQTSSSRAAKAR